MWQNAFICLVLIGGTIAGIVPQPPEERIEAKPIKTTADRFHEHGYPGESHYTETYDNYVINLFRVPYSPRLKNEAVKNKPVVFLQHGMFSCSESYMLNGPDDALAYNFVDAGFDVWLGNARGNIYSRNNTRMSPDHPYFWDFSWHEIGAIDIAQMIDYILEETGQEQLHYVGHSQGGTVFFVLASWLPEYNKKIKTASLLAPAVFMGNTTDGLVMSLYPYVGEPNLATYLLANHEVLPNNPLISRLLDTLCRDGEQLFPDQCDTLIMTFVGDGENLNKTLLAQLPETHPSGISTNQGIHYIQLYVSNKFRRFDYGVHKNLKRYNQETPPDYPLEKITIPTHIYYGLSDTAVNYKDLERLPDILPNLKKFHKMPDEKWGHLDFIFAMNVREQINEPVIATCRDYENGLV